MIRMIPLLLLCVAFQGQEPPARESPPPQGRQTGPFRFSLSADKPVYRPDDPILVTSVLRNEADHDLSIFMSSPIQFYGKDVMLPGPAWLPFRNLAVLTDEGQRQVFPGHMSASSRVLKPGDEIVSKFELNKIYVMPVPGYYHVVFHFRAPDYIGKNVIVMSNEIVVTIAKAAP
jgi:hypothetical protein